MMPDDVANLIYKEIYNDSLNLIKKKMTTQREYDFCYKKTDIDLLTDAISHSKVLNAILKKIIDWLNENVRCLEYEDYQEEDDVAFGEPFDIRDYRVTGKDKRPVIIREDVKCYEDGKVFYTHLGEKPPVCEITYQVLELIFKDGVPFAEWHNECKINKGRLYNLIDLMIIDNDAVDNMRKMLSTEGRQQFDFVIAINHLIRRTNNPYGKNKRHYE